jgi:hypothetical protein
MACGESAKDAEPLPRDSPHRALSSSVVASPRISVSNLGTSLFMQDGLIVDVDQRILNEKVSENPQGA